MRRPVALNPALRQPPARVGNLVAAQKRAVAPRVGVASIPRHPGLSRGPTLYLKMNKTTLSLLAGTLAAGGLLAGCASAPDAQMMQAAEALAAAESTQANLYVADLFQAAEDSFAVAQAEIEVQNEAAFFARDYDRAEALLAFVTETATTASAQVEERKITMRAETEMLITQTEEQLTQAQTLLEQAPRSGEAAISLVSLTEDTGTARQMLSDAVAAFAQEDIATAHGLAQRAHEQATALVTVLQAGTGTPRS